MLYRTSPRIDPPPQTPMKKAAKKLNRMTSQKGLSIPELLIVLLIISIVVVLALPQVLSSRRLLRFAGVQRQIVSTLRETRQEAMTQRTSVTFRYDNLNKTVVIYGGSFGALGAATNRRSSIADSGLVPNEVIYGKPAAATVAALGDGTNHTPLVADAKEITFRADGSVVDGASNPIDSALFFYDLNNPGSAFAVSVLGAGGRVKVWRFVEPTPGNGVYVE